MTTYAQLVAQRAAAGTRYANAVAELRAALIDLAALDGVLNNENVKPAGTDPSPTFTDPPDSLPWSLAHPVYMPKHPQVLWRELIQTKRAAYVAAIR